MSLPNHETFEPGGYAWMLGEDYIRHSVNGRLVEAGAARDAMVREMLKYGASSPDIDAWQTQLEERVLAREDEDIDDAATGPDPREYISVDGSYP